MPIYEYKCKSCDKMFEVVKTRSVSCAEDEGAECPDCKQVSQRIEISNTSHPVFKGKGFYATDYKNKHT